MLDTMTVVGTRTETSVRDNPASVSVVEREQIEKRGADSVAELLRDVPGVSVVDTAVAGMKRIRIRGEQSNRVVILVDGQEMTDQSSYGAPFLIDPSNIERIEVVRGPASVLYGAKAIGGVVNVITKKGAAEPVQLELGAGYFSGSKGKQASAAVSGTLKVLIIACQSVAMTIKTEKWPRVTTVRTALNCPIQLQKIKMSACI